MTHLIDRFDVEAASHRIEPWIRQTPVLAANKEVSGLVDQTLLLKLDSLQRTGSFKARGAFNAMLAASIPDAGVVAASGGNHGAAVAYAAMRLGHPATIFVPETAPAVKVARLRAYGATVHQIGRAYAEAFEAAQAHDVRTGAHLLHAYDDLEVVAGQGTAALEFERQARAFGGIDTFIVAVGGGGLIGGTIAAVADLGAKIIAVESVGTPTLAKALDAGHPVDVEVSGIAADALGAGRIGGHGFRLAQAHLHAMVLVEDQEIRAAQLRLWDEFRIVAEPGGAAAFAAVMAGRYRPASHERLGVIVCGGNANLSAFQP
jgi:threonine dehydratase